MYPKILNKNQSGIIKKLEFLKDFGLYLAGGTALALQLGHRTSVDFDFYTQSNFDAEKVVPYFTKYFNNFKVRRIMNDTLLSTVGETDLTFFYYPYKLIGPFVKFESINLASIKDIVAMKIAAIVQRGKRRDFIDVYYLLQKYSLEEILNLTVEKYPGYQIMMALKSLIYFDDAEKEDYLGRKIEIFDKDFSWEKTKKKIFEEVKKYQLAMIKN